MDNLGSLKALEPAANASIASIARRHAHSTNISTNPEYILYMNMI